jgi:hypothetical protein
MRRQLRITAYCCNMQRMPRQGNAVPTLCVQVCLVVVTWRW